jgi:cytochrome c oxidase cbb3-type subunit 3
MPVAARYAIVAVLAALVVVAGAVAWTLTSGRLAENRISPGAPEGVGAVVPLGIPAGEPPKVTLDTGNPLGSDPTAVEEGKKLFRQMNCAGCHGYTAKGGMGPDLTDTAWRYGGRPIDIYKSIFEGRPQGMPAWGNSLPSATVWQLVAYIQSLGGTSAAIGETVTAPNTNQGQGASAGQSQ